MRSLHTVGAPFALSDHFSPNFASSKDASAGHRDEPGPQKQWVLDFFPSGPSLGLSSLKES